MAWPAWGLSAGGWLFRCEGMNHRQGPCQAVRQLLGLGDFVSFSSVFFPAGLDGEVGHMFSTYQIFFRFPPFFSSLENRGFGSLFVRFFFFSFFFYLEREFCGLLSQTQTSSPCLASLAARGSHTCTLALCCPAHQVHLSYY